MTAAPRRRLGRGLTSLISTAVPVATDRVRPDGAGDDRPAIAESIRMLNVGQIQPNPRQPRQEFDEGALRQLGESIRTAGLMQPIIVRPDGSGGFELVVGERRWRAARMIGLEHLPAVVREMDDRTAAEWALIENIQREDLNPMERAGAFRRLIDDHGLTHQEVAERVGLNRSTVSNFLRLHDLDDFSREAVRKGLLSQAHARVLLAITNISARTSLARMAIRQDWSVRMLDRKAAALAEPRPSRLGPASSTAAPPHRADLERRLGEHLGTKVHVQPGKKKGAGRLVLEFYSFDQFEGLMRRLGFKTGSL